MTDDKPDPRPHDPYRRVPATIDLRKGEFSTAGTAVAAAGPAETSHPAPQSAAGNDAPSLRHAEEQQEAVSRSTHDRGASFETPASRAPQEDAVRGFRPDPDEAPETAIEPMAATALDTPHPEAQSHDTAAVTDAAPGEPEHDAAAAAPMMSGVAPSGAHTPPAEPRSRGGAGGLIAASLFGGVIGAGLAIGADTYWRQPPADFESRLSALETRPRPSTVAATAADNSGLDRRIAALESGARALADGVAAAKAAADSASRKAADLAAQPRQATSSGVPDAGAVSGLGARVAALEAAAKAAPPADALAELGTRLQAMQSETAAREASRATALASVQSSATALGGRLDGVDGKLSAVAGEVAKLPPGLMQAGLRLVVAGQASEALRSGAPLGPALTALEKFGMGGPDSVALRPYADQPAPGAAMLAAEFRPLAEQISAQSQAPAGSIGDRFLRMADKIVTVRAVGDGSGQDVPGLLRRVQLALDRGALPEAAATFDQLPEGARGPASAWAARLKQRVAADAAARRIGAASLSALDSPAR